MEPKTLLALDAERVIVFKATDGTKKIVLPKITPEDYRKIFSKITIETENEGTDKVLRVDNDTPFVEFIEAKMVRAEGFKLRDGSDASTHENWRNLVPLPYKLRAAEVIQDVKVHPLDPTYPFDARLVDVALEASWNEGDKMVRVSGLVHRFALPTVKHQAKVRRAMTEARTVGGSRTNRTIYGGKGSVLLDIYDELIVAVDGYAINGGVPLCTAGDLTEEIAAQNKAKCVEWMDGMHKYRAVEALFEAEEIETA
jgi:hypothetical protein